MTLKSWLTMNLRNRLKNLQKSDQKNKNQKKILREAGTALKALFNLNIKVWCNRGEINFS